MYTHNVVSVGGVNAVPSAQGFREFVGTFNRQTDSAAAWLGKQTRILTQDGLHLCHVMVEASFSRHLSLRKLGKESYVSSCPLNKLP